jgi:hypothetical protein
MGQAWSTADFTSPEDQRVQFADILTPKKGVVLAEPLSSDNFTKEVARSWLVQAVPSPGDGLAESLSDRFWSGLQKRTESRGTLRRTRDDTFN